MKAMINAAMQQNISATSSHNFAADDVDDILNEFGTRVDWFKNDKFLRDLEGDSVDTDILDEELRSLAPGEDHSSCRGKLVRFLESNPLQIVLCVLVLVDAGVVVAEILLDLHAIRGQLSEAESQLDRCLSFIKTQYSDDLNHYEGHNVDAVLTILGEKYPFNVTESAADKHSHYKRHVLGVPSEEWFLDRAKSELSVHLPLDKDPSMAPNVDGQDPYDEPVTRNKDRFISHALYVGLPEAASAHALSAQSHSAQSVNSIPRSRVTYAHALDADESVSADAAPELDRRRHQAYDRRRLFPSSMEYPESEQSSVQHYVPNVERGKQEDSVKARPKRASDFESSKTRSNAESYALWNDNKTNRSVLDYDKPSEQYTKSQFLIKIAHILHYISIAILGVFVIQLFLKIIGSGCLRKKMEIFDAVIIIASFLLDIVFMDGGVSDNSDEAAALVILFLLWRLLRVINGIMVTAKQRQEFRIKLQKRARRKADKRIEALDEEKSLKDKEIASLQVLCQNNGVTESEIGACKPRRRTITTKNTSTGLSSIASLSLGFTMSMSGAGYGQGMNAESRRQSIDMFGGFGGVPVGKGGRRTSITSKSSGDSMSNATTDKKTERMAAPITKPSERILMESVLEENNGDEETDVRTGQKGNSTVCETSGEVPVDKADLKPEGRARYLEPNGDAIHVHADDISERDEGKAQETTSSTSAISKSRSHNGLGPSDKNSNIDTSSVQVPPRAAVIAMDIPNGPIAIATSPIEPGDLETNTDHIHWFRRRSQECMDKASGLDQDWPIRSTSSSSLSIPTRCQSSGSTTRGSPSPKSTSSKS